MSARAESHEFCGRCPRCEAVIATCRASGASPELALTRRRPQFRPVVSALTPRQRKRPGAGRFAPREAAWHRLMTEEQDVLDCFDRASAPCPFEAASEPDVFKAAARRLAAEAFGFDPSPFPMLGGSFSLESQRGADNTPGAKAAASARPSFTIIAANSKQGDHLAFMRLIRKLKHECAAAGLLTLVLSENQPKALLAPLQANAAAVNGMKP